jgi:membrane protein required for colicin V production
MHTIDILFLIACIFLIIIGIRRGLVGEVFRLLALAAGFCAAFLYYPEAAAYLHFGNRYFCNALAFIVIFLAAALIIIGIGWVIKKIIHLTPLGWIDYFFGGVIGLVKAMFIFWVICLSFASFPATVNKMKVNNSFVFATYNKLPPALKLDAILQFRNSMKKNIDRKIPAQLQKTQKELEKLKAEVDSAKQTEHRRHR